MSTFKRFLFTFSVSVVLIGFISFLLYVIYVFGYYDKNEMNELVNTFNKNDFNEIHELLVDNYDIDSFNKVIDIMYNKATLKDIYYLYYSGSQYSMNDFYNEFYYGNKNVLGEAIEFERIGKTSILHRSKFLYKTISVSSRNGKKSTIGVLNNIVLEMDEGSSLSIDNKMMECVENKCYLGKIYGGLHEIQYVSNNITYYGLLNLVKNDEVINVSGLDSLVKINSKDDLKKIDTKNDSVITPGIYYINKCYMSNGCGNKKRSYIKLYKDNTAEIYTYVDFDQAGDFYKGTYYIDRNYLVMTFKSHVYSVYDYDYKLTSKIETEIDVTKRFKITNAKTIVNTEYLYTFGKEIVEEEDDSE